MKILVLTHRSNFSGGANRSLLSVLIGLRDKGHEIDVIVPKKVGELNEALTKEGFNWKYCRYYRMGAKRFKGIGNLLTYSILYGKYVHHYIVSKKIIKNIKRKNYDIIYTNTILPYAGLFASKKLSIPSVIHDRESLSTVNVPQIKNFERFLYEHSNKIIVISRDLKEQWKERKLDDKVVLINNGIPLEGVKKVDQDIKEDLCILLTARISPMKHHMDALKALLILRDKGIRNIKLYFAGSEGEKKDSEYKEYLLDFINKNNLKDNVSFLGEVKDMASLRGKMHVELMCNPNEPFGRVTVEGMRSGLVVIGVKSGGTLDIIKDKKNGVYYQRDSQIDLADKIELVYSDKNFRETISDYAYKYSNNHFTMEENVDKIEETLFGVVNN